MKSIRAPRSTRDDGGSFALWACLLLLAALAHAGMWLRCELDGIGADVRVPLLACSLAYCASAFILLKK